MTGMQDRVAALGGTLRIDSRHGAGPGSRWISHARCCSGGRGPASGGARARARDGGFEVVGAVGDAAALLELVERERVDVAIVDIRMPPTHTDEGLVAAEDPRAREPSVPVIVLSQNVEPATRSGCSATGGVGSVTSLERVAAVDDLLDAVDGVGRGGTAVDPAVVAALVGRRRAETRSTISRRASARSSSSWPRADPIARSRRG